MKKVLSLSLIIATTLLLVFGCKKNDDAPSLPPAKSMTIDFSDFVTSNKSAIIGLENKGGNLATNINWYLASTTASFWNLLLTVNLIVPVASFAKAMDNKPVYLENKKWQWKYSVPVVGSTYNARLTGEIESNDVRWKMYISKDGAGSFAEFLWFDGTSALDGKSGQWILYHSQLFQEPFLQIDWVVNGTDI